MTDFLPYDNDDDDRLLAQFMAGDSSRVGDLLKHDGKSGGWTIGIANEEVKLATRFVAIYQAAYAGFVKWVDTKPNYQLRPARSNPDLNAFRETLGDLDQSLWTERTSKGLPKDPWQSARLMPVANPSTGEVFTFSTSNGGGVDAFGQFMKACHLAKCSAPEETKGRLPLVEVNERSYEHKRYGVIFNPVLTLVPVEEWVLASSLAPVLTMLGVRVPTPAIAAKPEPVTLIEHDDDNDIDRAEPRPVQRRERSQAMHVRKAHND